MPRRSGQKGALERTRKQRKRRGHAKESRKTLKEKLNGRHR